MSAVPLIILAVAAIGAYQVITRRNRPAVAIGPQGRWWWAKMLVAFAVASAGAYALVRVFIYYRQHM